MKFILRRAKDTQHLMLYETDDGFISYFMHFPQYLAVLAVCAIVALDRVGEWWKPWSVIALVLFVFYLIYRLRKPWQGEKLSRVQAASINDGE